MKLKNSNGVQKILDHRSIIPNEPICPLAHVQLGHGLTMQGKAAKARVAYQDLVSLTTMSLHAMSVIRFVRLCGGGAMDGVDDHVRQSLPATESTHQTLPRAWSLPAFTRESQTATFSVHNLKILFRYREVLGLYRARAWETMMCQTITYSWF
jgi:hypothetical protein